MLAVDAGEILGVARHDLQKIVRSARHQVAFQHIGHPADRALEGVEHLVGLPGQRDLDKDRGRPAQPARIEKRDIAGDEALGLEPLHPAVAGRGRQVRPAPTARHW